MVSSWAHRCRVVLWILFEDGCCWWKYVCDIGRIFGFQLLHRPILLRSQRQWFLLSVRGYCRETSTTTTQPTMKHDFVGKSYTNSITVNNNKSCDSSSSREDFLECIIIIVTNHQMNRNWCWFFFVHIVLDVEVVFSPSTIILLHLLHSPAWIK